MKYAMFLPGGLPEAMIDWAKKIEARGIFLVPITMVAIKAKSS